jgi:hypothetical protein
MKRVCVICEGQTEETFVRDVLAPHLMALGLNVIAQMIETSPGHRGGALNYERVRRYLRHTLRQSSAPVVTTFFDLYRLDKRFPDFELASSKDSVAERVSILNAALESDIVAFAGCSADRFIPHIQPYEFEALLFSDVATLTSVETHWANATNRLMAVRQQVESPEHINDQPETKPAAHLDRELTGPRFSKLDHGPIAAAQIGLPRIERECRHFASWVQKLRALAPSAARP